MLKRRYVLLDDVRDADLVQVIDGAASKTEAMRALMRAGLQAQQAPPALDLAGIEETLRRIIRAELAGLSLAQAGPVAAGGGDEAARAKLRGMFARVAAGGD